MTMFSVLVYPIVLFLCKLGKVFAGEFCYYQSHTNLGYSTISSLYCNDGCCGYYYHRNCCTSVGVIAGAVVAILICLGVIGVAIAYLCISHKSRSAKATSTDNVIIPMTSTATIGLVKKQKMPGKSPIDHPAPATAEPLPGQMGHLPYQTLSVHQMNIQPLNLSTKQTGYQQLTVLPAKTREPTSAQMTVFPAKSRELTPSHMTILSDKTRE